MTRIASSGITVDLPAGWEAEIYRRPADGPLGLASGRGETTHAVLHAGNFPLPTERGDFGSGAVEVMRPHEVLVVLFEYHPESAGTALFAHQGLPGPLSAADFAPETMQRQLRGQAGTQRFFSARGRAFCLYVVLGSFVNRHALVERANELIAAIDVEAL